MSLVVCAKGLDLKSDEVVGGDDMMLALRDVRRGEGV